MVSELEKFKDQRLADEIKTIAEQLNNEAATDNSRLAERIFVGVFLPFFAGDDPLPYPVNLSTWLNVSRSVFASVDVFNERGEVLFTVPPMCERDAVQPVTKEGLNSIAHVVASTTQLSNVSPRQGQAFLNNELSKRAFIMKVPVSVSKHIEVWNKIFERYGRPPLIVVPSEEQTQTATAQKPQPGDDFDYQSL